MQVRFSIFCPQYCRTARELFDCLLYKDDTVQTERSILLMGDVAYDARFSVCNKRYTKDTINRYLVTSPFKSMFSRFFGKIFVAKQLKLQP